MGVVARSALTGLATGVLIVGALTTFVQLTSTTNDKYSFATLVLSTVFFTAVVGGVSGTIVGTGIGFIRRSLRPKQPKQPKPVHVPFPQQPYDMWSEQVERCAESTRRVAAAVQAVPKSPAKDWLQRISEQLTKELDDVRGIAQLGRALGAVDRQHPVYQRLLKAAHDYKQFENEVGRVALQMFDHPELDAARTHLEVLEKQLPQLS
ncbi:hypothetical protein LFM09_12730 [Lentzea alba]|uniref:hypothetical protein n=1 Tax=Lentzea alba TaxID=2714351 RepID=UPI0039BFB21C